MNFASIFRTPLLYRVFQIAVMGGGRVNPPQWGKSEILLAGIFLPGGGNLRRSDFDDSNLLQS